jgi:hypothetical protein
MGYYRIRRISEASRPCNFPEKSKRLRSIANIASRSMNILLNTFRHPSDSECNRSWRGISDCRPANGYTALRLASV